MKTSRKWDADIMPYPIDNNDVIDADICLIATLTLGDITVSHSPTILIRRFF